MFIREQPVEVNVNWKYISVGILFVTGNAILEKAIPY
jgi:hypothetical protein